MHSENVNEIYSRMRVGLIADIMIGIYSRMRVGLIAGFIAG